MTGYGYKGQEERLLKRAHRLEGQARGVGRMIEDGRYCIDIVHQLSAIQAAARQLSLQLLDGHVRHCVVQALESDDAEPKINELMTAIERALGT